MTFKKGDRVEKTNSTSTQIHKDGDQGVILIIYIKVILN